MKIIGVTGLPGSGKSVVSRAAKRLNIPIVRMGDVIREEAKNRNKTTGEVAVELRKEYGEFVVADRCVEIIKNHINTKDANSDENIKTKSRIKVPKCDIYMIEGIRSPFEVKIFKKNFDQFKIIAIHSTPNTRFKRLKRRMRPDDSRELSDFLLRDERELKFGIGDVIATSDYMVVNEGPLKKIKSIIRSILENEMQNNCKGKSKPNRRSK
jgi:dephospho-CoA kinase